MPSCCHGDEYGDVFTSGEARRTVARFRRRGLKGSARRLASAVTPLLAPGATVIEAGGGAGEIQVTLLESEPTAHVINVELSPSWEEPALNLLKERGLIDRVERMLGNFVDEAAGLPPAQLVILHRVVCCYPDWEAMIETAAVKASRAIALTVPIDVWWNRLAVLLGNLFMRLRGVEFRAYLHSPDAMAARLETRGWVISHDDSGLIWRTFVAEHA
ncbi:hypothetical protein BH23ACT5_BH23ACT5_13130 [soil metagenome]